MKEMKLKEMLTMQAKKCRVAVHSYKKGVKTMFMAIEKRAKAMKTARLVQLERLVDYIRQHDHSARIEGNNIVATSWIGKNETWWEVDDLLENPTAQDVRNWLGY